MTSLPLCTRVQLIQRSLIIQIHQSIFQHFPCLQSLLVAIKIITLYSNISLPVPSKISAFHRPLPQKLPRCHLRGWYHRTYQSWRISDPSPLHGTLAWSPREAKFRPTVCPFHAEQKIFTLTIMYFNFFLLYCIIHYNHLELRSNVCRNRIYKNLDNIFILFSSKNEVSKKCRNIQKMFYKNLLKEDKKSWK